MWLDAFSDFFGGRCKDTKDTYDRLSLLNVAYLVTNQKKKQNIFRFRRFSVIFDDFLGELGGVGR